MTPEGRVTFIGHDVAGAEIAAAVLARLRASERLREHVAALTRHHLRLGFLVHEMPLGRRAIYRYLRACEPVQVDVTLLSVADRLATRGRGSDEAIARHLELARELLGEALAWREVRPRPPVRGDELARAVGLRPGPELGQLLAELEEASFAGEISSPEEAIDRARAIVGGTGTLRLRAIVWAAVSDQTASSARSSPASCRRRSSTRTSGRSRSWTSTRRRAATLLVIPRRHARDLLEIDQEDLAATMSAAQRLARRVVERLGADGVNLLNSLRRGRLADRVPLPHARDPALRGRSAAAALDPRAGRSRRDRGGGAGAALTPSTC